MSDTTKGSEHLMNPSYQARAGDDDEWALLRLMLDEASHFTGSGKDDDSELGEFVRKKDPREILAEHPDISPERADFLLEKWAEDDIYDYGVTNDLGWFYMADARNYARYGKVDE
jgi:hypothetical protein